MKGLFLRLRGMVVQGSSALLAGTTATDDELVARLVRTAGTALGLSPRAGRVATTGGLALATALGVVDGVHGDTTDGRALALPPHPAGLAPVDVALLGVAHLADRGAAAQVDVADLARRHTQLGVGAVLGDELDLRTCGAGDLGAAARLQLDGVHGGTRRDVAQRQAVARLDVRRRTVLDGVALLQPVRREDVALLAVGVVQQRDPRSAVGVVLDVCDLGRHAVLVVATEVDDTVGALVATTDVAGGDPAGVVAATALAERTDQRLLRRGPSDLDEVGDRRATTARGGRLVLANSHVSVPVSSLGRSGARAEDVDGTLAERDDGALGVLALADAEAGAPRLALAVHRVDRVDLDVEDLLDGDLDFRLVRPGVDEERVLALVEKAVGLLRDDRGDEDVARVLDVDAHLPSSLSCVWPASVKPAASAASAVRNQTSAIVASYHWPPGWWYFIESALPLMSKPAGADASSSAAAESGPYSPSVASATASGWSAGASTGWSAGVATVTNASNAPWVKTTSSAQRTS